MNKEKRKKAILVDIPKDRDWWVNWEIFRIYEYVKSVVETDDFDHDRNNKGRTYYKIYKKDYDKKSFCEPSPFVKEALNDFSSDIICGLYTKDFKRMFRKID